MNISLSLAAGNKKQKKGLAFGLNSRKKATPAGGSNSAFGDDDDESSVDGEGGSQQKSRREIVNEQIAREQAARRRRAKADLASLNDKSVFDYDGAYDSFQTNRETKPEEKEVPEKKSKYIEDLLKAAKVRAIERDAIHERKHAREQAEEDAQEEFQGKEKFVTNSYKRKLKERKQWEAEQEEQERVEAANDVTKKSAGTAFAGFYGNLNRSTIEKQKPTGDEGTSPDMTGGEKKEEEKNNENANNSEMMDEDFDPRKGFLGGFQRSSEPAAIVGDEQVGGHDHHESTKQTFKGDVQSVDLVSKQSIREVRERKVAEARMRYLKRKQALMPDQ